MSQLFELRVANLLFGRTHRRIAAVDPFHGVLERIHRAQGALEDVRVDHETQQDPDRGKEKRQGKSRNTARQGVRKKGPAEGAQYDDEHIADQYPFQDRRAVPRAL